MFLHINLNLVVPAYSLYKANVLLNSLAPHLLVFTSVN